MKQMAAILLVALIGLVFPSSVFGCGGGGDASMMKRHVFHEVSECYTGLNIPQEVPAGKEASYLLSICSNLDRLTQCVKDRTGGCLDNSGNPFGDAVSKIRSFKCACKNIQAHLENYSCYKSAVENPKCLDMSTMPINYTHTPYIPDSDWDKFCQWYKGSIDCRNMMIATGCPSISAVAAHQQVNMAGMHSICKQRLNMQDSCEDVLEDTELLSSSGHVVANVLLPTVMWLIGTWAI